MFSSLPPYEYWFITSTDLNFAFVSKHNFFPVGHCFVFHLPCPFHSLILVIGADVGLFTSLYSFHYTPVTAFLIIAPHLLAKSFADVLRFSLANLVKLLPSLGVVTEGRPDRFAIWKFARPRNLKMVGTVPLGRLVSAAIFVIYAPPQAILTINPRSSSVSCFPLPIFYHFNYSCNTNGI